MANATVNQGIATALDDPSYPYASHRHHLRSAHEKYCLDPDKRLHASLPGAEVPRNIDMAPVTRRFGK